MKNKQSSDLKFEKFTWKIENFSRLHSMNRILYSEPFVLCGYPWMMYLFPVEEARCLSICLVAVQTEYMSEGWSRTVNYRLLLFNQLDTSKTIMHENSYLFNDSDALALDFFTTLAELHDPSKGFIMKDTCIVGAEICLIISTHEKRINQLAKFSSSVTPKLEEGRNGGKLMDFKGLGQIEKAFIPLLVEVCSLHHSLIVCQQERSQTFREWAFNALGRVLHFLKTKKVKYMNDLTSKELQVFWEELQHFSFDLTWLDPHVNSALGMNSYLKKLEDAEKLKDNVNALEFEMETHKDNAVALELELFRVRSKISNLKLNLDVARDLLIAENLEDIDLEAELGFVKP